MLPLDIECASIMRYGGYYPFLTEYVFVISTSVVQRCRLDVNRIYPLRSPLKLAFLINPIQLEDSEGRRNYYYRKAECCYKKEERKNCAKTQNHSA